MGKKITHDTLVDMLFEKENNIQKQKATSLFLASLSLKNLKYRSGLSVYAIMQSFPNHTFSLRENQKLYDFSPCAICSRYPKESIDEDDIDMLNESISKIGGIVVHGPLFDYYYIMLKLEESNLLEPNDEDFRIFSEMLTILMEASEKDTVKKSISSRIGKIKGFKSNAEQRKALLETLGYCGILETLKHKGLLSHYTNLGTAPSKTHSSDWKYPVDFWTGKDGINKEAFKFWFGDYPELEKFWK